MKSFLSTRAGGSFFCGSNRTVVYHKDNLEFILRYDSPNGKTWGYASVYAFRRGRHGSTVYQLAGVLKTFGTDQ